MLKKTILATLIGSTLLASGASFADNRHWGHDSRRVVVVNRPVVQHYYPQHQYARPAYVRPVYVRPAPRVVVVQRPVYVQRPAPVYYGNDGLAILAGAVIGGAIAYQIATH
jgi:uncharacterized protein YcfJ